MFSLPNGKVTIGQVLLPVSLVAFVLFIMMAFQFTQIMRDRDAMEQVKIQQDKPLAELQKVQTQFGALAQGTNKLAKKGDKTAKGIIERLAKLGITVNDKAPTGAPPSPPPSSLGSNGMMAPASAATKPPTPLNGEPPPADR